MLDWHSCQICYPLEIKILLLKCDAGHFRKTVLISYFLRFWQFHQY